VRRRSLLDNCLGPPSPSRVHHPLEFRILANIMFSTLISWFVGYMLSVYGLFRNAQGEEHLAINANAVALSLAWFTLMQAIHMVPCVSSRAGHLHVQRGRCKTYFAKLLFWDGSLYVFLILSLPLLWLPFLSRHATRKPEMLHVVCIWGVINAVIGMLCWFFACWHRRLILSTLRPPQSPGASEDIVDRLESCTYEDIREDVEEVYSEQEQCAICLGSWEPTDTIKVTPCKHIFHQSCLATWLQHARTCALCRTDIVSAMEVPKI